MDSDISFGDVQHAAPEPQMRPDQNRHFAVLECGTVDASDLPMYVDLDVMIEMECHALSNTRVELGGVLLGGQYVDDSGKPFVVISDALRAEHYEATRGSFKFTHDTWQAITRQREAFPDELQMVGWYHTHPDWGVFLSGMDLFICDNFFNRPLDLALVIDPCRDERGWFYWTQDTENPIREAGGFYLFASRFREQEIDELIQTFNRKHAMASDPRLNRGSAGSQPIVHLHDARQPGVSPPVAILLALQIVVLGFLLWQGMSNATRQAADSDRDDDRMAKLEKRLDQSLLSASARQRESIYQEILSKVTQSPQDYRMADELVQLKQENLRLRDGFDGQVALSTQRRQEVDDLSAKLSARDRSLEKQKKNISRLESENTKLKSSTETENSGGKWIRWSLYAVGALALVGIGFLSGYLIRRNEDGEDKSSRRPPRGDSPADESVPKATIQFESSDEEDPKS